MDVDWVDKVGAIRVRQVGLGLAFLLAFDHAPTAAWFLQEKVGIPIKVWRNTQMQIPPTGQPIVREAVGTLDLANDVHFGGHSGTQLINGRLRAKRIIVKQLL
jgi:hypothetical protein